MKALKKFFKELFAHKEFYYHTEQVRFERRVDEIKSSMTYWKAG